MTQKFRNKEHGIRCLQVDDFGMSSIIRLKTRLPLGLYSKPGEVLLGLNGGLIGFKFDDEDTFNYNPLRASRDWINFYLETDKGAIIYDRSTCLWCTSVSGQIYRNPTLQGALANLPEGYLAHNFQLVPNDD